MKTYLQSNGKTTVELKVMNDTAIIGIKKEVGVFDMLTKLSNTEEAVLLQLTIESYIKDMLSISK